MYFSIISIYEIIIILLFIFYKKKVKLLANNNIFNINLKLLIFRRKYFVRSQICYKNEHFPKFFACTCTFTLLGVLGVFEIENVFKTKCSERHALKRTSL